MQASKADLIFWFTTLCNPLILVLETDFYPGAGYQQQGYKMQQPGHYPSDDYYSNNPQGKPMMGNPYMTGPQHSNYHSAMANGGYAQQHEGWHGEHKPQSGWNSPNDYYGPGSNGRMSYHEEDEYQLSGGKMSYDEKDEYKFSGGKMSYDEKDEYKFSGGKVSHHERDEYKLSGGKMSYNEKDECKFSGGRMSYNEKDEYKFSSGMFNASGGYGSYHGAQFPAGAKPVETMSYEDHTHRPYYRNPNGYQKVEWNFKSIDD